LEKKKKKKKKKRRRTALAVRAEGERVDRSKVAGEETHALRGEE
jgi:hypothetical protein